MKKLIYLLLMLTLVFSCSKPSTPEQTRFQTVIEHLKDHYPESEYMYLYEDSTKQLVGFRKDKENMFFPSENNNTYYYYNEKGDKVKGYVFMVNRYAEDHLVDDPYVKIIILSEDNEVVWCGTDYPKNGCTGECTKKITNLDKCNFDFSQNNSNSGYDSIDTTDIEDILEK